MFKTKGLACLALLSAFSVGTAAAATPTSTTKTFVIGSATVGSLTINQLSSGTEWLLSAGFTGTATTPKIENLLFTYTGSSKLNKVITDATSASSIKIIDTGVQFDVSNGKNSNPFTAGESMKWTFAGTDLSQFTVTGLTLNGYSGSGSVTVSPVPEPSTYGMMLVGGLAVAFAVRRRKSGACQSAGVRPMMLSPA